LLCTLTVEKTIAHRDLDQMFLAIQKEKLLEISKASVAKIPEIIMAKHINIH
jgi:hypothetical protein